MRRDQIMREIALYKEKLTSLKEQLKNCYDSSESEYVGKFYIQNRYESGLRFMYVLDEDCDEDRLDFYGCGAEWDYQCKNLEFYSQEYPNWFTDVTYGELKEVTEEELIAELSELVVSVLKESIL